MFKMKNLDKKGFTLIELLAVIVVLAIVTVIATQTVLPFMANAGRDTFASEANMAIDAASDAMSLISLGSVASSNYTEEAPSGGNKVYCFTIDNLKNLGLFQKDDSSYEGTVTVTVTGNTYTYATEMKNDRYYVKTTSGTIKAEDYNASTQKNGVGSVSSSVTLKTACVPKS